MRLADLSRHALLGAAGLVVTILCAAASASASTLPNGFGEQTLAAGFTAPTAVAWAPDGRMFVAEKGGMVWAVPAGSTQRTPLVDISEHVNNYGDRGLLDVAVDSDFANNHYLYLLYVHDRNPLVPDGPKVSRLTRVTVTANNTVVNPGAPETVVLGAAGGLPGMETCPATPSNSVDCIPAEAIVHSIGAVRADTDGTLWVSVGDSTQPGVDDHAFNTYDERSYLGKILHVDRSGHGVAGHPFCPSDTDLTHVCSKVYAKGFRNPYRFTLRPGKGPAVGDVGEESREELSLLAPGRNYGWPCYEGDVHTPGYADTDQCAEEYAKEGTAGAASPPAWSYAHAGESSAIVPGPFYTGGGYPPDFVGQLLVGDYARGFVKRLTIDSGDQVTSVQDFATDWAFGGVDLERAPNGNLAYVDIGGFGGGNGTIREIVPTPGNATPTPRAGAAPAAGLAPLTVQFKGSDSTDPDAGDSLTYAWDFGDNTFSTETNPSHIYAADGPYTAKLTVTDTHGSSATTRVEVAVGRPPQVTLSAPADGSTYVTGAPVSMQGSATDPDDGALPGSALRWHVLLHHATHLHDVGTFAGLNPQFTTPTDHGADSFYEITLTATDSTGLSTSRTVEIVPKTITFGIESNPPGAAVSFALLPATAPYTTLAAVGSHTTVSAAETVVSGGRTYTFDGWSDGGARVHNITVPATDTTLVATYDEPAPPVSPVPPAVAPPPPPQEPPAVPPTDSTRILISGRELRVRKDRSVRVWLLCVRSRGSCGGRLAVHSRAIAGARQRRLVLGRARFRLRAGAHRAVDVQLTRSVARILATHGRISVLLAAATSDLAGERRRSTRAVFLRD